MRAVCTVFAFGAIMYMTIFLDNDLSATQCNTQAVDNGSPSFFVDQSREESCLASDCSTESHAYPHQQSHINSCTHSGRKNNACFLHKSGMSLEDKVSL